MKKFIKKPIEIEAIQFDGMNAFEIQKWSNQKILFSSMVEITENNPSGKYLEIKTLEGILIAIPGDWIIKGVKGEFYPCKPDIFEMTYDEVKCHGVIPGTFIICGEDNFQYCSDYCLKQAKK